MKNKLFIGLLLSLFAMQACVKDEEKVFDASAAERMKAAIQTYKAALCAAPDGWVVEYYPEPDRYLGGYNLICKFNEDGTVEVASEAATNNYPAGDPAMSMYDVIANEGAVLTFNTYNEVLHFFTEPNASDVDGFAGDYEFIIREATPEQIVMTGKKYGNSILLTPYTGGDVTTWGSYLKQFRVLDNKILAPAYLIQVDGEPAPVKRIVREGEARAFRFLNEKVEDNKVVPYIPTTTGIKLYEPITILGKTAQYFIFNEAEETLTSVEPGSDMVIKLSALAPNEFLAETKSVWKLDTAQYPPSLRAIVATCAASLLSGEGEEFRDIFVGDSPFGPLSPGRGFVFTSYGNRLWSAQYPCVFTPVGANLEIEYKNRGEALNEEYYYTYYKPFLDAINANSPYSVVVNDPKNTTRMTITSVADPGFYFVVAL